MHRFLSVTLLNIHISESIICRSLKLYHSVKVTGVKVKGRMSQGKAKARDIGRWAHFNIKLHF